MCHAGGIRVLAGGESPQGWMRRGTSREGRNPVNSQRDAVYGCQLRTSSGDGTRRRKSRLRDSPRAKVRARAPAPSKHAGIGHAETIAYA